MDLYGDDRRLSDLDSTGFNDFLLDRDVFNPPSLSTPRADDYGFSGMDTDWLETFFEDPVLNDRMITDAIQPPRIQSEHSYSSLDDQSERGYSLDENSGEERSVKEEPADKDYDMMPQHAVSPLNLTTHHKRRAVAHTQSVSSAEHDNDLIPTDNVSPLNLSMRSNSSDSTSSNDSYVAHDSPIDVVSLVNPPPSLLPTNRVQTVLKANQPTIILTTQAAPLTTPANIQERLMMPKVEVKLEPQDDYSPYDRMSLPPTPPSSNTSDSESSIGGLSPQRSAPSSPIRHSTILRHHQSIRPAMSHHATSLFSSPNYFQIPTSGVLILSEEEKRTLISEGYPIPQKLPLNKQEEKNLKKIRRKIKNKISAQESRRKKKDYLDCLEKRVEQYSMENGELRKKVDQVEVNNRSLLNQLQKLQAMVSKMPRLSTPSNATGTCLMVLVLCFSMFLGSWSPSAFLPSNSSSGVNLLHDESAESGGAACSSMSYNVNKIGPLPKDPTVDAYTTPMRSSRVLMSIADETDEEYGPAPPSACHSFLAAWFHSGSSDQTSASPAPLVPEAQVPRADNPAPRATKNPGAGTKPMNPGLVTEGLLQVVETLGKSRAAITVTANLTTANMISLSARLHNNTA